MVTTDVIWLITRVNTKFVRFPIPQPNSKDLDKEQTSVDEANDPVPSDDDPSGEFVDATEGGQEETPEVLVSFIELETSIGSQANSFTLTRWKFLRDVLMCSRPNAFWHLFPSYYL